MLKEKIGLVLGGGGAKGFAHIGVLKALEEEKIPIDSVAGTSIGSVVGALHCLGYTALEIEEIAKKTNFKKFFDINIPKKGLIKGDKIETYLRHLFENKKFSQLNKPLFVVATDIKNFQEVIFKKGDLTKAVRASISIPGIFNPVINNKRVLVDGGILNNLPINVLEKDKLKKIIAINLEKRKIKKEVYEKAKNEKENLKTPNIFETLLNSYSITEANQIKKTLEKNKSAIIISPDLEKMNIHTFEKIEETIKEGYDATKRKMPEIKKMTKKERFISKLTIFLKK